MSEERASTDASGRLPTGRSERGNGEEPVAGPQPASAVDTPLGDPVGAVLDPERRALLAAALDVVLPPTADLPGAGALGVVEPIEAALAASAPLRRLFLDGLHAIALAGEPTEESLRAVEASHPAFFAALVSHAYRGYYTQPRVLQALESRTGYPARPPQPLGHDLPPFDERLLEKQRQRAPFWRRA